MAAQDNLEPYDRNLSLALAMVCASPTPLLLLDGECRVIAASSSFCDAFQVQPADCAGKSLFELRTGMWEIPQLRALMSATISGDAQINAYEAELRPAHGEPRSIVLSVRKLVYGDDDHVRVLVAIADVTEVRATEKAGRQLMHDNGVLSQEIRHRVANSLQIIASVMMLNARQTSSEEVRGHLRDAHNRVMSIADLQRQLAVNASEEVNIRSYLTKLCATIAASMIADPKKLVLTVTSPETPVGPDVSVSLGLIVTELVINCLKHAFRKGHNGAIEVAYETREGGVWMLSVTDNGSGMAKARGNASASLGTTIVQALARQLRADVNVEPMNPGTRVSIVHTGAPSPGTQSGHSVPQVAV